MFGDKKKSGEQRAEAVICFLSLLIAALLTGMVTWKINVSAQMQMQQHLAEEVLRFHVLALSLIHISEPTRP